jgi:hypothetical protein
MKKLTLYRYEQDGRTVVSLDKPSGSFTEKYRLVADEGKVITNGLVTATVIDTDSPNEWSETVQEEIVYVPQIVEMPEEEEILPPEDDPSQIPKQAPISTENLLMSLIVEHEYRLALIEMGVS